MNQGSPLKTISMAAALLAVVVLLIFQAVQGDRIYDRYTEVRKYSETLVDKSSEAARTNLRVLEMQVGIYNSSIEWNNNFGRFVSRSLEPNLAALGKALNGVDETLEKHGQAAQLVLVEVQKLRRRQDELARTLQAVARTLAGMRLAGKNAAARKTNGAPVKRPARPKLPEVKLTLDEQVTAAQVVPPLLKGLRDKDPKVAETTIATLAGFGKSAIGALGEALGDPDPAYARRAAETLRRIAGQLEDKELARKILEALKM